MKRFLLILLLLTACLLPSSAWAQFKDLQPGHPAYPFVDKLVREGILEVGKSKKFEGRGYVNKYQLAVVLDRLYSVAFPDKPVELKSAVEFYKDVPVWSYANTSVGKLTVLKIFEPDVKGNFNGNQRLNRYYFYYFFCRFIETSLGRSLIPAFADLSYADLSSDNPYYPYILKLIGLGLLSGGKFRSFQGDQLINRLEMALFTAKVLDYLRPEGRKIKAPSELAKPISSYTDVPSTHYAREAIEELVEVGILSPGPGQKFEGDRMTNKFELLDFLSRILEKLLVGEEGELELADAAQAYKDVGTTHPYYRSVQKLIALGILPAGNREEVLNGELPVNRYQLAYFLLTPLEKILSPQLELILANASLGYRDVPKDNFAYPTIQKMIELKVLPGGADRDFKGEQFATRFDLAYISVQLLKQIYLKIKEEEISILPPSEYGFKIYLNSEFTASSINHGQPSGEDLIDVYGLQTVNLTFDRQLGKRLSAYVYLQNQFYFGTRTPQYLGIREAYLMAAEPPLSYQFGRIYNYHGYSPFGASLFFDSTADLVNLGLDTAYLNFSGSVGKLLYNGDVTTDSNLASLLLTFKNLPMDVSLGGNLITDPLDPTGAIQLPTKIWQTYGGININLFGALEANLEASNVDYSNPEVLPLIGLIDEINTGALQAALSYYEPDYGYSISFGYQRLGDDFYNANLTDPGEATYNSRGRDALLFKTRFTLGSEQNLGIRVSSIYEQGLQQSWIIGADYSRRLFKLAYLNLSWKTALDSTPARQNSHQASANISLSF
jgi:hypothetical protein